MATDSFFALTCASTIGLLFGFVLAFAGYRFFIFLLPVWGFFWGFGFGAQTIQALFNSSFLGDITSWVVGFFMGLLFAALSYLFFAAAVAIAAGSLGYALGAGIMLALGFEMGVFTFLVGIVVAIAFVIGTFVLDLYKWIIILATSVAGAGVIVGTFLFVFGQLPTAEFIANPVKAAINDNPVWWLIGLAVAVLGFIAQVMTTRYWTLKSYSRWGELTTEPVDETYVPDTMAAPPSAGLAPAMAGAAPSGGMVAPPAPAPEPPPMTAPSADLPPEGDSTGQPPSGTGA